MVREPGHACNPENSLAATAAASHKSVIEGYLPFTSINGISATDFIHHRRLLLHCRSTS